MNTQTRLTVENENGKVSIVIPKVAISIESFIDELFIPLLLGAGYGEKTIAKYVQSDLVSGNPIPQPEPQIRNRQRIELR